MPKGIEGTTQLGNTKEIQANYTEAGKFLTVPKKS